MEFKISLADVETLKKQFKVIKEFITEIDLKINKDDFGFTEMTPDNIAMVIFKVLSSSCIEYDVKETLSIGLNVNSLYGILKVINKNDVVVLSKEQNNFIIEAKGRNTKKFKMPIIDLGDKKEETIPELKPSIKVITDSKQFKEELNALDTIAESVLFSCDSDKLILNAQGEITQLDTTIKKDDVTIIQHNAQGTISSKYSIEFLKKILEGSVLDESIVLEFDKDYPLKVTFQAVDKWRLQFILAPRVETE